MTYSEDSPSKAAKEAAETMLRLSTGELADLRRMKDGSGTPTFWRLATRFPKTVGCADRTAHWTTIIRVLAVLTPKGDPKRRSPLHDGARKLGEVLCDGGDRSWPPAGTGKPMPAFGERRLAQLIAARGMQRAKLLERAVRFIEPGSQLDVVDVAYVLLTPDDSQLLATPYYRRLDRAERDAKQSEKGTD